MKNDDVLEQVGTLACKGGTLNDWKYVACNLAIALREARKDTERLDWLGRLHDIEWSFPTGDRFQKWWIYSADTDLGPFDSIREVVDAARAAGGEG